jgi:hypothetical protein
MWLGQFDGSVGSTFDFDAEVIVNLPLIGDIEVLAELFDSTIDL